MSLQDALAPLIDFVFPPRCPLCGGALAAQGGLCGGCWGGLEMPAQPGCGACQRPLGPEHWHDSHCGACVAAPPLHDGVAAGVLYNPVSRQLVLALKNGGRLALAPLLGRLIAARLVGQFAGVVDADWLVVPVPLHRWRLWQRGFNQSALLARAVAQRLGAPLALDALVRRRYTAKLRGLTAEERHKVVAGAIAPNGRRAGVLAGRDVVLVDDVLTSGATSDACIAALKAAGARRVVVACFARVLGEELA